MDPATITAIGAPGPLVFILIFSSILFIEEETGPTINKNLILRAKIRGLGAEIRRTSDGRNKNERRPVASHIAIGRALRFSRSPRRNLIRSIVPFSMASPK